MDIFIILYVYYCTQLKFKLAVYGFSTNNRHQLSCNSNTSIHKVEDSTYKSWQDCVIGQLSSIMLDFSSPLHSLLLVGDLYFRSLADGAVDIPGVLMCFGSEASPIQQCFVFSHSGDTPFTAHEVCLSAPRVNITSSLTVDVIWDFSIPIVWGFPINTRILKG